MKFTRKEFLKASTILAGGIIFQGNKLFWNAQDQIKGFKTIRNNIGIYTEYYDKVKRF